MSYESTLAYIHSESWQKHKNGLERIRNLLTALGNPQDRLKFIHVAGTNGKGSTCAMLDSVLRKAGYKVGLFTSPFIHRFNERMRIDGLEIADDKLEEICNLVRPHAEAMAEKPSEFELICAIGMVWFAKEQCDIVVLEVGLGGEFDSTNVISCPECAAIASIGLDHTEMLGDTIALVAKAKAGIIKLCCDVVTASGDTAADEVFRLVCEAKRAHLTEADLSGICMESTDASGSVFSYKEMHHIRIGLAGIYQPKNAALAIEVLQLLIRKGWNITEENIREGLADAGWPGRFERIGTRPEFILDGAHNPHGIQAAVESLKACYPEQKFVFLVGAMRDKALDDMLNLLVPIAKSFVATRPDIYRALPAEALAAQIREKGAVCEAMPIISEAVQRAQQLAGAHGVVCALGSLYFSSDIRKALKS